MKKIFVIALLFATCLSSYSQRIKNFSDDPNEYPTQITDLMGENLSKEQTEFLNTFFVAWDTVAATGLFTDDEKLEVLEISNLLLKRKARGVPHFMSYFEVLLSFKNGSLSHENYINWHIGLKTYLENKARLSEIVTLFGNTLSLVNKGEVYSSASTIWKSESPTFVFTPQNEELRFVFTQTNLTCYSKRDSMHLYDADGSFDPINNIWYGTSGRVTWQRAGYGAEDVWAKLNNYNIEMKRADYSADSVIFHYNEFFEEPLEGKLIDKVMVLKEPGSATYPKFESYRVNFKLDDMYPGIDYEGGLSMQGARMIGTGSDEADAHLYMSRNDTLFLTAASKYFSFREEKVVGRNTQIKIQLGQDSIYHPDLQLNYMVYTNELSLIRTGDFTSQGPYYNSYQNIDMNFEELYYVMGEPLIYFKMQKGRALGDASFISANYFNYNDHMKIQRMDAAHPLVALKKYANRVNSDLFTVEEYANYIRKSVSVTKHQLMEMSYLGYIFYNPDQELVQLKDKLYTSLAASVGRIDYDVMDLESTVKSPLENAVLDLRTYDLSVNGVPEIFLSDSQNVRIEPANEQIIMKNDRDFSFDGKVEAGYLTFYGNNFFFEYDTFKINLQNIDSLAIKVEVGYDNYGQEILDNIKNMIEHITGELLIDYPNNKSGFNSYPEYPIFHSKESSYVYYDNPNVEGGVYDRASVYFEVYPFSIDSLDNFSKDALSFEGKFVSGGIMPDIEDTIKLQPDMSMGFVRKAPPQGMPIYGGKATIYDDILLSNSGIQSSGKLEYITSTTYSDLFQFFPDSMNTHSNEFDIKATTSGSQYPWVKSKDNYIHWEPKKDNFAIYQKSTSFELINNQTTLDGSLLYKSTGLEGSGRMDLTTAELDANKYRYKTQVIDSDTSDFDLKSLNATGVMVRTNNVKSHVDFKERKGLFKSNDDYTLVHFPKNKYISFLDYFVWNMDSKELEMGSRKIKDENTIELKSDPEAVSGPRYISVHKHQDSLEFVAPLAYYNYEQNIIDAKKVPYIDVADARIYPDNGDVVVKEDAKMKTLVNARVVANRTSRHHILHTARINILGKYDYLGEADYDYVDENGEIQIIHFNEVKLDTAIKTIANGNFIEPDSFMLSPVYAYQGKVKLFADSTHLLYDGAVQLRQNCDLTHSWMKFEAFINPNLIYIPVQPQPIDINNNKIYAGTFITSDSTHIYPSFMSGRKNYSDTYITTADGFMFYDIGSKEYRISSKEKLKDRSLSDNYTAINRFDCYQYSEGEVDLGVNFGLMKIDAQGNVMHRIDTGEVDLDLFVAFDFFLGKEVMDIISQELDSLPYVEGVDLSRAVYRKSMNKILGAERARELQEEMNLYGEYKKFPDELNHTLVLNQLNLKWDQATRSYKSVGKIGVASIGDNQINKLFEGAVQIQKKRSGDICDIYLKVDDNLWYYFGYTRGVMQTLSSNMNYIATIDALKPKLRKQKKVKGQKDSYIYMVSTEAKFRKFLAKFYSNEVEEIEDDFEEEE